MVALQVAVEGHLPCGAGQLTPCVDVPGVELERRQLRGVVAEPVVDVHAFARGQGDEHEAGALLAGQTG